MSFSLRITLIGLLILVVVSTATAFAAGLTTPGSNVDHASLAVTAEDIKPAACNGITLTQIISGSGTLTGSAGNDLIIGSSGDDIIDGLGGNDCILGGSGDDSLTGGEGTDVCLGSPGNDSLIDCELEGQ